MPRNGPSRRTFLNAAAAGATIATLGVGSASAARSTEDGASSLRRGSFAVLEDTEYETTLRYVDSVKPGPTALVVGGIHGDERAGYAAADAMAAHLAVDAGRVVVIPKANAPAVEAGSREGPNGDLNRQFPVGETPSTEPARTLWEEVRAIEPEIVVDLHETVGLYEREPSGVGQAVFYTGEDESLEEAETAERAVEPVNDFFVPEPASQHEFRTDVSTELVSDPSGLFVTKTAEDLAVPSFLVETYDDLPLPVRVNMHWLVVEELLSLAGLVE
ncbi:M99 family carboxypeptidase catalytic domain-containing protein [Halegenticoccus tardaugens]|uniref:M99 family carboxypeptidase catalytic domain-containing protein n=1 Tax=Halegenticoccus tardaugens TaxID=2071624 RepID=UPI0013E95B81|nr:succinylglutamate desuccinylase/aspartoacylase family protein [Halegenticoccus tardaugens]